MDSRVRLQHPKQAIGTSLMWPRLHLDHTGQEVKQLLGVIVIEVVEALKPHRHVSGSH